MADLDMDVDVALAEVPVNLLPLLDDTDFKSIEGAVAYNAGGMALRWHFVTTAGAYTVTSVTPTTGGDYDWTDQGDSGVYTIEIPASGGASINNDTEGFGWFTGVATGILPWRGPVIRFRAAALNNAFTDANTSAQFGLDINNIAALTAGPLALLGILESGVAQSATGTTLVGRAAATNDIVKAGHTLWAYGSSQAYWQSVMIDSVSGDTFTIAAWPVTTPTGTIDYLVQGTPTTSANLPLPANVTQLAGVEQSLTDLKDFADAGYDPSTNKLQGVVLVDTVTTYTGNTVQTGDAFARLGAPAGASVSADIAAIEAQTDDIGAAGAGLTALASAANLATVAGYLDTEIAAILALLDDARGEPGQGSPPVNPDLATKIDYLYKAWRNRSTQTASEYALYADDGTTKDQEAACTDDGTTFVRGEVATGA